MLRQMEVSEVRRRLRGVVEQAKRHAAERRARNDDASRAYDTFLAEVAIPAFHEFIELALDTTGDAPLVMLTTARGRGRRQIVIEQPLFEGRVLPDISQDDVVVVVIDALLPFVER
jgi:hypothetical protein